jgi:hypothetical protein
MKMNKKREIELKILGDKELVLQIRSSIERQSEGYEVISSEIKRDRSALEFGLVEVAALLTVIQGTVFLVDFANKLLSSLKQFKSKTVVLQTPLRRIEVKYSKDLTEKELERLLKDLANIE